MKTKAVLRNNNRIDGILEESDEHGKKLNVKLKWHWNLNSISLTKCKLSVHIVPVKLIVGKLMPATLSLSVSAPHCYLSFGKLEAEKSYIEGSEDGEAR